MTFEKLLECFAKFAVLVLARDFLNNGFVGAVLLKLDVVTDSRKRNAKLENFPATSDPPDRAAPLKSWENGKRRR